MGTSLELPGSGPSAREAKLREGDKWDAMLGVVVGAVVLCLIVAFIVFAQMPAANIRLYLMLSGVIGGCLGWASGMAISPYNREEAGLFGKLSKTLYGLVTGYLVAKIDPLVTAFVEGARTGGVPPITVLELSIGLVMFVAAAVVTFTTRRYSP